ncbi:MAG: hypothetical protein WCI77_03970 [Candidatus Omnitrophota bacterium]
MVYKRYFCAVICFVIIMLSAAPGYTQNKDNELFGSVGGDDKKYTEKKYYPSGQLLSDINYRAGKKEGSAKWYYKNGNQSHSFIYKDDLVEGDAVWYYENGTTERKAFFKNGYLDGTSKEYYENGQLKAEAIWDRGRLLEYKRYLRNGESLA